MDVDHRGGWRGPWSVLLLVILVLLFSACAKVRFTEQRIFVRHDVENDVAEVLLVYQGLYPSRSSSDFIGAPYIQGPGEETTEGEDRPYTRAQVREAVEAVAWIEGGRRFFIVGVWALEIDLDDPDEASERSDEERGEEEELVDGISVTHSGLYLDEQDQLCAYQVLRIPRVSLGLRLLNEAWHETIRESGEDAELDVGPSLDARTCELWREDAVRGVPWVMMHEGGVRVRIPMTPYTAARTLESILADQHGEEGEGSAEPPVTWASCLTGIEIADEHLTLDFRSGAGGEPTWVTRYPEAVYSDAIARRLEAQGWQPRRLSEAEVLAEAW